MIQAKVDGVPVFDCHYGTSNGKYAIKIDQLLTSSNAELAGRKQWPLITPMQSTTTRWPPNGRPRWPESKAETGDGGMSGALQTETVAPAQLHELRADRWHRPGPATTST